MKYKKIAFITEDIFGDSVGGVEQHIFHVAKNMVDLGYEVRVFSLKIGNINSRSEEIIHEAENGCSFTTVRIVRKSILLKPLEFLEKKIPGKLGMVVALVGKLLPNLNYRFLINEINSYYPSIVHQHDYLANIFASKVLSKKYPVVFTNHTGQYLFLEKNRITRMLQKKLIAHYKAIIGPSSELTPSDKRATYITNGVDVDFFSGHKELKSSNKLIFICPRRWAPTKGVIYLVKAMKLLPNDVREKVVFAFAGSSSDDYPWYRDEINNILNTLPNEMFILLGNLTQEELKKQFLKSDVVVIPSLMEATSLAAMEGMAAGLPVLSTNVGGMPDVVINKEVGWLVNPEDAVALAETIKEIVNLKYDLSHMGKSAKQFVIQEKSWKKISTEVTKIYNNVLSKEF